MAVFGNWSTPGLQLVYNWSTTGLQLVYNWSTPCLGGETIEQNGSTTALPLNGEGSSTSLKVARKPSQSDRHCSPKNPAIEVDLKVETKESGLKRVFTGLGVLQQ